MHTLFTYNAGDERRYQKEEGLDEEAKIYINILRNLITPKAQP